MKSLVLCDNGRCDYVAPLCIKYGAGIEIQGFYNPNDCGAKDGIMDFYKKHLPEKIGKHFHAPFWDLCLGSANIKIRDVTRFYFDYALEIASELGCETITVHHGFVPNTSRPAGWIKRSSQFWNDFFASHNEDIVMCMENVCEQNPDVVIGLIDNAKNEKLGANLDIGHANCYSNTPVLNWIERLAGRIKYAHLHDNFGENDDHLALGKGSMDITEICNALNKYAPDAIWALESDPDGLEESVKYLKERGFV